MPSRTLEADSSRLGDPGRLDAVRAVAGAQVDLSALGAHLTLLCLALDADGSGITLVEDAVSWPIAAQGELAAGHPIVDALATDVVAAAECRTHRGPAAEVGRAGGGDTSTLAGPIAVSGGHIVGALHAHVRGERGWSDHDRVILTSIGELIASRLDAHVLAAEEHSRFEQMVGTLAHDLRAPVSSIASAARLLAGIEPTASATERLRDVVERADGVARELLTDLVERALATSADVTWARPRTRVTLAPLLRQVAAIVSNAREVEVRVRCDDAIELWTEPLALHRVVQNLTDNAAHHSGSSELRIEAAPAAGGIEIAVEDDGAGFPPELATWLSAATSGAAAPARPDGLGLGLRTCVALAAELGAHLRIDATPGSRVVIRLPVREGDADPTPAA